MRFSMIGLCFLMTALAACSRSQPNSIAAGSGIFGGIAVSNNSPLRSYVVVFRSIVGKSYFTCSGTSIAPRFVLVNAHCLKGARSDMKVMFFAPSSKASIFATYPPNLTRGIVNTWISPKVNSYREQDVNPYDIALLELDQPAPEGVRFFTLSEQTVVPETTSFVYVLGYGYSGVASDGERLGDMSLQTVTQSVLPGRYPGMFVLDGTHGRGTCLGDSGGPVFIERNNQKILVGLTAQRLIPADSTEQCQVDSVSIDISVWKKWIESLISESSS